MFTASFLTAPRSVTRAEVLRTLFEQTALPRNQLADRLHLTGASISRIVAECMESGLIVELLPAVPPASGAGRRPVPLALNPAFYAVAGIHVGLLWVDVGLFNLEGTLIAHRREPRPVAPPPYILERIATNVEALVSETDRELLAAGISLNGQVDVDTNSFSSHNVLGWPATDVTWLADRLQRPVISETDTYATALAEFIRSSSQPDQPLLLVNVGTSIGMGLVVNRTVVRGKNGLVGSLEHLPWIESSGICAECGQRSCLTNNLADRALLQHLGISHHYTEIHEVLAASHENGSIRAAIRLRAEKLGRFLATLALQYDPGRLVLAGSCLLDDGFQMEVVQSTYTQTLRTRNFDYSPVERPTVYEGELLPLVGAGTVALNSIFSPNLDLRDAPPKSPFPRLAYVSIEQPSLPIHGGP